MVLPTVEYLEEMNVRGLNERLPKISRFKKEIWERWNNYFCVLIREIKISFICFIKIKVPGLRNRIFGYCMLKNDRAPNISNLSISSLGKPKSKSPGIKSHLPCELNHFLQDLTMDSGEKEGDKVR